MATLRIGDQRVQVGDEFLRMSPEQQNAAVAEIAGQIGQQPAAVSSQPPPPLGAAGMQTFTVKAPDGRQIQIRARDQATALSGAQAWAAANPAQPRGAQRFEVTTANGQRFEVTAPDAASANATVDEFQRSQEAPSLADFRLQYPEYADLTDDQLADALHSKFYSDIPREQFDAKIGLGALSQDLSARSRIFTGPTNQGRYNAALRKVRESQFSDMTDQQWQEYSGRVLAPYRGKDLAQQSQTFGFGDEMAAAIGGFGSQVRQWTGGGGLGYGQSYGDLYELEQARLEYGRELEGPKGTVAEILGGLSAGGPARNAVGGFLSQAPQAATRVGKFVQGAVPAALGGAAYGFGSTDGDLGQRAMGAGAGAALGAGVATAAPLAGKVIQGTARAVAQIPVNTANRSVARQAVRSAPTAAAIKASSQAAYRAAEATGAVINPQAMQLLSHDMLNLARVQGLIMPSGRLSTAFPKVANALRAVREYAGGPMDMAQAKTLLRTLRTAQKSIDPDEARLGGLMVEQFEDFLDSLPPAAFAKGYGEEAVTQWARGRTDWARSKRVEAVENIIEGARTYSGGFDAGVRAGFKKILKPSNSRLRRGFSQSDLAAMRRVVEGGPVSAALKHIGSGSGLPGVGFGGLAGGVTGAVAVPVVGAAARGLLNRQTRGAAELLRAQVATPGGLQFRALPPPVPVPGSFGAFGAQGTNPLMNDPRVQLGAMLGQRR